MQAGPEGDCPTCARPLGAEYGTVLGLLDRQMEGVIANGNFYKQRIEQLQVEPRELDEADRQRVVFEQELSEATGEAGRLEALAQEGTTLASERGRRLSRLSGQSHDRNLAIGLVLVFAVTRSDRRDTRERLVPLRPLQ